jgi:hypothetical protein
MLKALATAFNRMIVDRELYNICKKKCSQSVAFIFRNDFKTMGIHFMLITMTTNNDVQFIEIQN